ncbi:hypothetical protein WA171_003183, partial [Blastocystis sp. BT1]
MLTRIEINDLLHDARMDSIRGKVKDSLLKYLRAMNEIEFNKEACKEDEREEWDKILANTIEEYNAVKDRANDVELYTDQLHNNESWLHHTVTSIGGIVNGFFQNPVVSYIGTAVHNIGETAVDAGTLLVGRASEIVADYLDDGTVKNTVVVEEPKKELEGSTSTETPKKEIEVPNPKKEIIDNASEKPIPDSETSEQEKSVPEQTVVEQEPKDNTEMNNEPVQSTEGVS